MYFKNVSDFIHMGGYAAYVWSAYGIVALTLAINIISPVYKKSQLQSNLNNKNKIRK